MSLIARSNPIGQDIPIAAFQKFLYIEVPKVWPNVKYTSYDRAYRELVDTGYVPRIPVVNSSGALEYKTISLDTDTGDAISFFHSGDNIRHDYKSGTSTAQISLVMSVNLQKVKPISDHRGDEEARNDIQRISFKYRGWSITGFETGYENVFREYKGFLTKDTIAYLDTHPLHVFRINFDVIYNLLDCTPTNSFSFNKNL